MSERESNGQFGKGNQAGKKQNGGNGGRLPRPKEEHLITLLDKAVPDEVLLKVLASGAARAQAGDVAWAKLLLAYKFGLPIQRTEIGNPEGEKLRVEVEYINGPLAFAGLPPRPGED